jgi:hypothetical protein
MTKMRHATPYRVDWFEGSVARVFAFHSGTRAWDKYVEGISNGFDEVIIYQFDGGRDSAVLLARHYFRKATYGTPTQIKKVTAHDQAQPSQQHR